MLLQDIGILKWNAEKSELVLIRPVWGKGFFLILI